MSRSAPSTIRPADLLPELHRRLLEVTGGASSVLLRQTSTGEYKAVSGRGFAHLGDVWLTGPDAEAADRLTAAGPRLVGRDALADLVDRLGTPSALIIPVQSNRSRTLLAVALNPGAHPSSDAAAAVATGFAAAIERRRART